jgi:hypothetical protein
MLDPHRFVRALMVRQSLFRLLLAEPHITGIDVKFNTVVISSFIAVHSTYFGTLSQIRFSVPFCRIA